MPDQLTDATELTEAKQYQCRHILADGHRCQSPCLRHEHFCYYHHTSRKPVADPRQRRRRRNTFHLPLTDPNDRSDLQASIGHVLRAIAANDIDPRRAGLLLYGLQIASGNLPRIPALPTNPKSARNDTPAIPGTVEEITLDPTHGPIAPRTEIIPEEKPQSLVSLLLERLGPHPNDLKPKAPAAEAPRSPAAPAPAGNETTILPKLQAAAETPRLQKLPTQTPVISTAAKKPAPSPTAARLTPDRVPHLRLRQNLRAKREPLSSTRPATRKLAYTAAFRRVRKNPPTAPPTVESTSRIPDSIANPASIIPARTSGEYRNRTTSGGCGAVAEAF